MDNNDAVYTERIRNMLNGMKPQDTPKKDTIAYSIGVLFQFVTYAVLKYVLIGVGVYWGMICLHEVYGTPAISFLQTMGIIVGARGFTMAVIDPIFASKNNNTNTQPK